MEQIQDKALLGSIVARVLNSGNVNERHVKYLNTICKTAGLDPIEIRINQTGQRVFLHPLVQYRPEHVLRSSNPSILQLSATDSHERVKERLLEVEAEGRLEEIEYVLVNSLSHLETLRTFPFLKDIPIRVDLSQEMPSEVIDDQIVSEMCDNHGQQIIALDLPFESKISRTGFANLAINCPEMKSLHMYVDKHKRSLGAPPFQTPWMDVQFPSIERLAISGDTVSGNELLKLATSLPNLTSLSFTYSQRTLSAAEELQLLYNAPSTLSSPSQLEPSVQPSLQPSVQLPDFSFSNLTQLSVVDAGDDLLRQFLRTSPHLEELNVVHATGTFEGCDLSHVKRLTIRASRIAPEVEKRLRQEFPNLEINVN